MALLPMAVAAQPPSRLDQPPRRIPPTHPTHPPLNRIDIKE